MRETWLEVALNGPWSKALQPGIPVHVRDIVAQGIACAREGAAIVHVHAYDETSGRQNDAVDTYARIIEGIREEIDCIVYPTIPFGSHGMTEGERYAAIEALGQRGLLEWAVVDPGSVNIGTHVYVNPEEHVRHGLALASRFGFHPGFAIYEAGFLRLGAALAREQRHVPQPVYRFMFSDGFRFGFPPRAYAIDAYLKLLAEQAGAAPWMVAGLDVDILPLVAAALARGGHVRVGLEDAPLGSSRSNLEWVRAGRHAIERAGGMVVSAAQVRAALRNLQ